MTEYALAVTVHDPDERLLRRFDPALSQLVQEYTFLTAACTSSTAARTKAALDEAGFDVKLAADGQIGESRRVAIRSVLRNQKVRWIQYADFDRLLHWQYAYPSELRELLRATPASDYTAVGRSERAMQTHPPVQILAETLTNTAFSAFLRLNKVVDVVAGSFLFSRRAADIIVKLSIEPTNATDLEWPALVLRELEAMPAFVEVEGLEFETADYYTKEIREAGSREAWIKCVFDDPKVWFQRTTLALDSIAAFARVSGAPGFAETRTKGQD